MKFAHEHPWMTFFLGLVGLSVAGEVLVSAFGGRHRTSVSGALPPPSRFPVGLNIPAHVLNQARAALQDPTRSVRGVG